MRTKLTALTLAAALAAGGAFGIATGSRVSDRAASGPATLAGMQEKIDALGYDVLRLKATHHGFKARIVDRDSGGLVQVRFDSAGELTGARLPY